jgi:hypothetical protein
VGEKGNVVDPGAVLSVADPSVIERTSSVVSSTVVQSVDTVRDKVIGAGADGAINEARDRLKERREAERSAHDEAGPELPPPPPSKAAS